MVRGVAVGLLFAVACQPQPQESEEDSRPELHIIGAETATQALLPELIASHNKAKGDLRFKLTTAPDGEAMRAVLDGKAELAALFRGHTSAEEEQAQANGYSLDAPGARHILAVNVVAVSVHPDNPLDSLTYDQIIEIFCTQKVENWSELGLEERPIRPLVRETTSGERVLFEDFFCGPQGISTDIEELPAREIAELLATDPSTISFISLTERAGKIVGLRPLPLSQPVSPTQQNIVRGSYPLAQDLFLHTPGPATGDVADFLSWIASPAGQEVVDESHFIPLFLRPELMDEPRPLRETVHFQQGSIEPTQRSTARLSLLIEELQGRAGEYKHIVLEGYTDSQEDNETALSRSRAEVVRDVLKEGLPGLFFEIIPRGAVRPIAPNETPFGRQQNRRVQIYLGDEEQEDSSAGGVEGEPGE